MPKILYKVTLTREEREALGVMTTTGKHNAQSILNALILLNCDSGEHQSEYKATAEISAVLRISQRKVDRVKERFVTEGLDAVLSKRRSERPEKRKVDGELEARVVATVCGQPPAGYAKWSLRLLADKVVELQFVDSISHESVRQLLKKTKLNLGELSSG